MNMRTNIGRYIRVLMKSPTGGPKSSIVAPPTAGPKSTAMLRPVELSLTALCRYSRPTMSWIMSWLPGPPTTPDRRVKLLEQHPVTDDMLDVVAHLRQHDHDEVSPVVAMVQRCESDPRV